MRQIWDYECAIIGGGPGGLVAALYLRRFRRRTIVVSHGVPRAAWIPKTHNLLGFDKGISGGALLRRLRRQVDELDVPRLDAPAILQGRGKGFLVETPQGSFTAKKVVLATGMEDYQPELANLAELRRSGRLRYCPICDAFEQRRQRICIFVRDDIGAKKAFFLRRYSPRLALVASPDCALSTRQLRQLREAGIKIHRGELEAITLENGGGEIAVRLRGQRAFRADVGYVELGARVRDFAFRHLRGIRRVRSGFLHTTSEQRLSLPGLFAVGDCVNTLAQISVAAGQAAIAATALHNDLLSER